MRPTHHVIASAGISLGVHAATHSWPATLGCFLSGVLIDIDHYWDYYLVRKKFPFKYKDLVDFGEDLKQKKVYLFFHGYEPLLALWLLIYFLDLGVVWVGVAVGLTTHLLCDQWTNPCKPLFYFMTYRLKHRFEKSKLLSKKYLHA